MNSFIFEACVAQLRLAPEASGFASAALLLMQMHTEVKLMIEIPECSQSHHDLLI